jgi:hypothetical protein
MNGRLLALVGAIALFVCLWNSPEPKTPARIPVLVARAESQRPPATRLDVLAPLLPALPDPPRAAVLEPAWLGEPLLSELPADLLPGMYRVVSTDGAVGQVLISGTVLGAPPQELVLFRQRNVNWYFIRQADGSSVARLPPETAPNGRNLAMPPLRSATPDVVPQPVEPDESLLPELTSKDRDIAEAQLRQWLKAMSVRVRQWVIERCLGRP